MKYFVLGLFIFAHSLALAQVPEVNRSLDYFRNEQKSDGSFTKLTIVSSPLYATHMIFLYEYLGVTGTKKDRIDRLMQGIWPKQNEDGGFAGYPGGESNIDISASVYLAAKIAGEPNSTSRLQKLESRVTRLGGLGLASKAALPYLMLFGLDRLENCVPGLSSEALLKLDHELPWERVLMYPFLYLLENKKVHFLSPDQKPNLIPHGPTCPNWTPHLFQGLFSTDQAFFNWLLSHMGEDGTFFDFTPTTVPALMALSTQGEKYQPQIALGVKTLESYQDETSDGALLQSPGEASIGESFVVLNAMLDMGAGPDDPMVSGIERFFLGVEQPDTGAFGFSKHNLHYPDSDDTSNAIYALKRLSLLRGDTPASNPDLHARIERGMNWLLSLQNKDGGFATWERETLLSKMLRKILSLKEPSSLVFSESVTEHSARIVLNLSLFKNENEKFEQAYERGLKWLLKKQNPDGSYSGAWFIDYLFGTAMVTTALGTAADRPEVHAAIEKALGFILDHQQADGGFSESPESFVEKKSVSLSERSSPAQTGLVVSELLAFLREEHYAHLEFLRPRLKSAIDFLMRTQNADGLWHDPTWTGVTFPKLEYSIYPYVQEISPVQAIGMFAKLPPVLPAP